MKQRLVTILSILTLLIILSSPAVAVSKMRLIDLKRDAFTELFRNKSFFTLDVYVTNSDSSEDDIEVRLERENGDVIGTDQRIQPGDREIWEVPSGELYIVKARAIDLEERYVVTVKEKPRVGGLVFAGALLLAAAAALLLWAARKWKRRA